MPLNPRTATRTDQSAGKRKLKVGHFQLRLPLKYAKREMTTVS